MTEKLCVFCKHFDFESICYQYYSTLTGGDTTGGMTCKKHVYTEERPYDTQDFRRIILKAETCQHYEPDTGA